jgi:hypothetical protein
MKSRINLSISLVIERRSLASVLGYLPLLPSLSLNPWQKSPLTVWKA